MGVEPYMVANSLVGVVAQRLMRKVCPYCKKEVAPSLSDCLAKANKSWSIFSNIIFTSPLILIYYTINIFFVYLYRQTS